jgi:adenylosuccinate synthase
MPCTVLLGCQWGDEGKAAIVDYLSSSMDYVVRFQGGGNAGHTVVVDNQKFILHYIPSGILNPRTSCVMGNGMVIALDGLFQEIQELHQQGIDCNKRLFISDRAHLVLPYHIELDGAGEESQRKQKIGTTRKGIGPTYSDKVAHLGVRVGNLYQSNFRTHLVQLLDEKNFWLSHYYHAPKITLEKFYDTLMRFASEMEPYVTDTISLLHSALDDGKSILLEGAQGTMLDVDFGTYPFVTSSNCTAGGACTGSGVPPTRINNSYGIFKTYLTRVGEGPMPTELFGEEGDYLRQLGNEFGSTTGRPRRCGWFDLVLAQYAAKINGLTGIILTKLDILDAYDSIRVCTHYEFDGTKLTTYPSCTETLENIQPVYTDLPGWKCNTRGLTTYEALPPEAKDYLQFLSTQINVPILGISTGPARHELIWLEEKPIH